MLALQDRYRLLYLTAPAVDEMEGSIRTLREVIAAHKETIAEKEAEIGRSNPAIFKTLQVRWHALVLAYSTHGQPCAQALHHSFHDRRGCRVSITACMT